VKLLKVNSTLGLDSRLEWVLTFDHFADQVCIVHQGLLERDAEHAYLTANGVDEDPESPMNQLLES
jgi:hypothetical protein